LNVPSAAAVIKRPNSNTIPATYRFIKTDWIVLFPTALADDGVVMLVPVQTKKPAHGKSATPVNNGINQFFC